MAPSLSFSSTHISVLKLFVRREGAIRDALEQYFRRRLVPAVFHVKADVYEGQEKAAAE